MAQGNIDNNRTFTGLNLDDTHVISPTAVLDVKASYFRFVQFNPGLLRSGARHLPQSLGMTNMIHAPTVRDSVIPNISSAASPARCSVRGSFSWSALQSLDLHPQRQHDEGQPTPCTSASSTTTKRAATSHPARRTALSPSAPA